jgi:hypothetical protein
LSVIRSKIKKISKILVEVLIGSYYPVIKTLSYDAKINFLKLRLQNLKIEIKFFFTQWLVNPAMLLAFFVSIIFNILLYIPYLLIFVTLVLYWTFKFIIYRTYSSNIEVKPDSNDNFFLWSFSTKYIILHILYLQTFYKAYLNSYSLIYVLLKYSFEKPKVTKRTMYQSIIPFYINFMRLVSAILFRLLTSIPKNIVTDSYKWSLNFKYIFTRRHLYKNNMFFHIRETVVNSLIKNTLYNSLFPKTYLRVYKTDHILWNFNPNYKLHKKLDEGLKKPRYF